MYGVGAGCGCGVLRVRWVCGSEVLRVRYGVWVRGEGAGFACEVWDVGRGVWGVGCGETWGVRCKVKLCGS